MPKLLDLFCGAGGAAMGYYRAGFDVTGVDIVPQPRYPFRFIQDDAIDFLTQNWKRFDVIHASPPCQVHSVAARRWNNSGHRQDTDWIVTMRKILKSTGKLYIIENVERAPLVAPIILCGTHFGLRVF